MKPRLSAPDRISGAPITTTNPVVSILNAYPALDVKYKLPSESNASARGAPIDRLVANLGDWGYVPPPANVVMVYCLPRPAGPLCITVTVCPAMVSVPVRLAPAFTATVKFTVSLPLPHGPGVTVRKLALLAAVQVHPAAVDTLIDPVKDAPFKLNDVAESVYVHDASTVNVAAGDVPTPGDEFDTVTDDVVDVARSAEVSVASTDSDL